ncbi:MAG: cytochrome c3 family protein [Gemmatimonadales bacterium]
MAKWVRPMAKASGVLMTGALLVVLVGAMQTSQTAPSATMQSFEPFQAPRDVDTTNLRGPRQPILYRHDIHAGQYQMDCRYCHGYVEVSSSPGLPSTAVCMGCHMVVQTQSPEVQKLAEAHNSGTPVEWVEVHELAQFVRFPHQRHVVAGQVACQECHGPVQEMVQVWQFSSLKMGWCLDCHKERGQTTDCTACHY